MHSESINLILCFTVAISSSYAQAIIPLNEGINQAQLEIRKGVGGATRIGDSKSQVLSSLGSPSSSSSFEYEMAETTGKLYMFGNDEVYIMYGKLYSFIFIEGNFQVGMNGSFIEVGDDVSKVTMFYEFANNFKGAERFRIPLNLGDRIDEGAYLLIEYNPRTNKVTKIWKYQS